jgi:ferredoxin
MFPQKRRSAYRQQYKKFVISCEGSVTEREYFTRLQTLCWNGVILDILTDRNANSPRQVLERIRNYGKSLSARDEMWCVIDKDQWTSAQFAALTDWQREPSPVFRGIALSNPKFELWLLAHFQELPITCGASECDRLLETHHPDYKKHIVQQRFDLTSVSAAITHAAATCPTDALPLSTTGTNVGELVRRILTSTVDRSQ